MTERTSFPLAPSGAWLSPISITGLASDAGATLPLSIPRVPASTWVTQVPVTRSVARSIRASGLWKTATGHAYETALRREAALLRAYLAVRLRAHARGRDAFEMLREALEEGHGAQILTPPGARAQLFLLARRIVEISSELEPIAAPIEEAPWDAAPLGAPRGYGALLDRVRRAVSEPELERLELSLAHCFDDADVAHILEESLEALQNKRAASLAWLRMQLEDEPLARGVDVELLVRDALRVLPPPASDLVELDEAAPLPLTAGTVVGERFVIEECVGGGMFGHVYRARDVHVPTHVVALKMLHRAAKTDAAREGAIAELSRIASAFHPNLVQLKEHGWYLERLWFVMPWYRGETLAVRLAREPLTVPEAARLLAPIARSLAALHDAGIRHQDVKPDNILLAELAGEDEQLPVLLDLGVAARSEDLAVGGTPMYFAPEMARRILEPDGIAPISGKADVFALAMTLLHAVDPPDMSEPDFDEFVRERAAGAPALSKSRRVAPLRRGMPRWLATNPADRPTAAELAMELEQLAQPRPRGAFLGRTLLLGAALVIAILIGVAVAGSLVRPSATVPLRSHGDAAQLHALRERVHAAEARAAALEERARASGDDPSPADEPGALTIEKPPAPESEPPTAAGPAASREPAPAARRRRPRRPPS